VAAPGKYNAAVRLDPGTLERSDITRRFDDAAARFATADYVHRATCNGLIERLAPVQIDPRVVVDLGTATGRSAQALAQTWRRAMVIGLDLSGQMLTVAMRSRPLLARRRLVAVRADAARTPFLSGSIDLVFANMLLPWLTDFRVFLAEVSRILRKGGVFAFATLGPDSFAGLRGRLPVCVYPDMHDLGDAMVRAGLADPVLDVDRLNVTFGSTATLAGDLVASGAARGTPAELAARLDPAGGGSRWSFDLELVYGHAWGAGGPPGRAEVHIDPGSVGRRGRR